MNIKQRNQLNVLLIYSLLIIDLFVNISDKLIPAHYWLEDEDEDQIDQTKRGQEDKKTQVRMVQISGLAFIVVISQITSIVCVIINLIFHFLKASDELSLNAVIEEVVNINENKSSKLEEEEEKEAKKLKLAETQIKHAYREENGQSLPMSTALKLIIDHYWWSLIVGLFYLVLTIIMQIVRLDTVWLDRSFSNGKQTTLAALHGPVASYEEKNENVFTSVSTTNTFSSSRDDSLTRLDTMIDNVHKINQYEINNHDKTYHHLPLMSKQHHNHNISWLPIIVSVFHKLLSTCYYVSLVVIYRVTPKQMKDRILARPMTINLSLT